MIHPAARSPLHAAAAAALELVFPARCAGCGERSGPCCSRCRRAFAAPRQEHPALLPAVPAYALARYRGVARELVLAYKERGRRDLAEPLGEELAAVLEQLPGARPDHDGTWWLVPAPSRTSAARVRGGSHTHALASECSRRLAATGCSVAVAPALRMLRGTRDTARLERSQRARNLAGRIEIVPDGLPPRGVPVVLLDDVLTTGATAAACAGALGDADYPVTAVLTLTAAC